MTQATLHILFYALIAAASPLALAATLVVIENERPRVSSIAFTVGFLAGATVAAGLGLLLGNAAVKGLGSHDSVEAVLALLLGLVLLAVAARERGQPVRPGEAASRDGQKGPVLAKLSHVTPAAASAVAGVLGFGGPKRLVITFLAMSVISGAVLSNVESAALVVLYVGIASVIVWAPVTFVLVAGDRGAAVLRRMGNWLEQHAQAVRTGLALVVGAALVVDGIVRLLA